MGPYLALPVLGLSPGLILLSRELLEARQGACPCHSPSPGFPAPRLAPCLSLDYIPVPGYSLGPTLLLAPEARWPQCGWNVWQKSTRILQTDPDSCFQEELANRLCRLHPSEERWTL